MSVPVTGQMNVRTGRRLLVARGAGAVAAGVGLAGGAARGAAAHHSYPATYDTAQHVTVSGTVQLLRFSNPHVHIVLEQAHDAAEGDTVAAPLEPSAGALAADPERGAEAGALADAPADIAALASEAAPATSDAAPPLMEDPPSTLWVIDGPNPAQAQRMGLTPDTLPVGTPLTILAWPSRAQGSHDLAPLTITFDATGHQVRVR